MLRPWSGAVEMWRTFVCASIPEENAEGPPGRSYAPLHRLVAPPMDAWRWRQCAATSLRQAYSATYYLLLISSPRAGGKGPGGGQVQPWTATGESRVFASMWEHLGMHTPPRPPSDAEPPLTLVPCPLTRGGFLVPGSCVPKSPGSTSAEDRGD